MLRFSVVPYSCSSPELMHPRFQQGKAEDPELFDGEYRKQLDSLDAKQVTEALGPNAILLCWESFNVRCHPRLVAAWLEMVRRNPSRTIQCGAFGELKRKFPSKGTL
jgi:hypothetical protein